MARLNRNESWHTYEWVMTHIWISHDTHTHTSRCTWHVQSSKDTYEWVMAHVLMSLGTRMNQSWRTYTRVMAHLKCPKKNGMNPHECRPSCACATGGRHPSQIFATATQCGSQSLIFLAVCCWMRLQLHHWMDSHECRSCVCVSNGVGFVYYIRFCITFDFLLP